jgi:hypothetical protein
MLNKTYNSKNANGTLKKNTLAESVVLTMSDLERIKKNATILSKDEEMSHKKILGDQKHLAQASALVINIKIL